MEEKRRMGTEEMDTEKINNYFHNFFFPRENRNVAGDGQEAKGDPFSSSFFKMVRINTYDDGSVQ